MQSAEFESWLKYDNLTHNMMLSLCIGCNAPKSGIGCIGPYRRKSITNSKDGADEEASTLLCLLCDKLKTAESVVQYRVWSSLHKQVNQSSIKLYFSLNECECAYEKPKKHLSESSHPNDNEHRMDESSNLMTV